VERRKNPIDGAMRPSLPSWTFAGGRPPHSFAKHIDSQNKGSPYSLASWGEGKLKIANIIKQHEI
jgi:hypothetical protein